MSDGKRLGASHNLPEHQARQKALEEAERRAKLGKIMGPSGGRTLGGSSKSTFGKNPRELMAEAAERRRKDSKSCGHGEQVDDETIRQEVEQQQEDSVVIVIGDDDDGGDDEFGTQTKKEEDLDDLDFTLPPPLQEPGSSSSSHAKGKGRQPTKRTVREEEDDDSDLEFISGPPPPPRSSLPTKYSSYSSSTSSSSSQRKDLRPNGSSSTILGKRPAPSSSSTKPPDRPKPSAEWQCPTCTYLNEKAHALVCEVCDAPREKSGDWDPADFVFDSEAGLEEEDRGMRKDVKVQNGW